MRYEVILVRYVPELVYCEVDAMDETKAVKKASDEARAKVSIELISTEYK